MSGLTILCTVSTSRLRWAMSKVQISYVTFVRTNYADHKFFFDRLSENVAQTLSTSSTVKTIVEIPGGRVHQCFVVIQGITFSSWLAKRFFTGTLVRATVPVNAFRVPCFFEERLARGGSHFCVKSFGQKLWTSLMMCNFWLPNLVRSVYRRGLTPALGQKG
jgi:hypothetical protein